MAESKLDRTLEHATDDSFSAKGSLSVGLDVEKSAMGFVDEFKDQQSESNIPLSPQWLYAKPTEIKEAPQENKRERSRRSNSNTTDTEISQNTRRWREEERETGLLGRRSKKDSNPNPNPNPINTTKWSSRWGPDDRETPKKDKSSAEVVPEKDHHDANPNPNFALRPLSEADSRDKWRPRHRQDSGVKTGAPGFVSERGTGGVQARQEVTNVGFAPGRGRASSGSYGRGRGEIGMSGFRYPRGKLLDIYRRNGPEGFNDENAPGFRKVESVTLNSKVSPLAFLPPDADEEVTLKEIYKGKLTGSDANDPKETPVKTVDSGLPALGETKYAPPTTPDSKSVALPNDLIEDPFSEITEMPPKQSMLSKLNLESIDLDPAFNATVSNLPDDSSLFEPLEKNPNPNPVLEEMSFFYRDPQGGIQGPFLGIDIMSWYEEDYFGLDLPICPSDAPEGTPYRLLADVMPHLRNKKSQMVPERSSGAEVAQLVHGSDSLDFEGSLEGNMGVNVNPGAVSKFEEQWNHGDNEEIIYAGRPRSGTGKPQLINQTNEMTDMPLWASNTVPELRDSSFNLPKHEIPVQRDANPANDNITPLGLLWSELESPRSKHPLSSNIPSNYRKPELNNPMKQPEISHFTLEEQLLSEQLQRQQMQQMQQIQQEQIFMRAGRGLGPQQASELEQLLKLQYEIEQQKQIQLKQQQMKQQQQEQQRREREQMVRQQKIQEQLMLEQLMREQQLQEQQQQMLREQQFLKELQLAQAQQLHRQQQDAAIEQLIQAKFGPAGQRQMIPPSMEQQILLGLQQRDPIQAQQLALALRQQQQQQQQQEQQRLEEEMLLRGVCAPGLPRTNSSRISQLERSLSLHEQLQSMERSLSLNANPAMPSPRNVDFAQTLAQLQGLELQERERQLQERQLQERDRQQRAALFGGFWDPNSNNNPNIPNNNNNIPNSQLERSLIESHLNHQMQLEAENQRRLENQRRVVPKPGLTLEDPHPLNEMLYQNINNMPLQSPSYKDPSLMFPRRNPSPNPNSAAGVNIEGMQAGFIRPGSGSGSRPGSFVEKQFFGNLSEFQNEEIRNVNAGADVAFFENFKGDFGEVVQRDQEPVRAPTPARHTSIGSSDDAIFKYEMGEENTGAFSEETIDTRQHHGVSRAVSSQKQNESGDHQQVHNVPRPPSRPASADASKQEARTGPYSSETQVPIKKESSSSRLMRVPSAPGTESDASSRSFIEMLKSTKKAPQPTPQMEDSSESAKGAKKKAKKGRQIDPALLGFKVHSNRIMMGEIQRPDEA